MTNSLITPVTPVTTTFDLSEAELAFVCATLDTEWLPGMSLDEDLAEDEARLLPVLQAGASSLTQRNILFEAKLPMIAEDEEADSRDVAVSKATDTATNGVGDAAEEEVTRLDEAVQATVLTCTQPEHAVSLISQQANAALQQAFFYRLADLAVLHKPIGDDRHQFELGAADGVSLGLAEVERVLSALPNGEASTSNRYTLSQEALSEATRLSQTDISSAAAQHLASNGLAEGDAAALAQLLAGLTHRVLVQFQYAGDEDSPDDWVPQTVLTFLSDGEQAWSLEANDADPEEFTAQPVTRAQAMKQVEKAFAPIAS